jgi:hypothetical protein
MASCACIGRFNFKGADQQKVVRSFVISHDRCFLDRIATHILAAEGDSRRDSRGAMMLSLAGRGRIQVVGNPR